MTLVSSFSHFDMDPGRSKARGVELLRLYLQYAASQGRDLGDTGFPDAAQPVRADVHDALAARAFRCCRSGARPGFGSTSSPAPGEAGRFVLAIECDGATYHSAPSAATGIACGSNCSRR